MKKERSPRSGCPAVEKGRLSGAAGPSGWGGGQVSHRPTVHREPSSLTSSRSGAPSLSLSPGPASPQPHLGMKRACV